MTTININGVEHPFKLSISTFYKAAALREISLGEVYQVFEEDLNDFTNTVLWFWIAFTHGAEEDKKTVDPFPYSADQLMEMIEKDGSIYFVIYEVFMHQAASVMPKPKKTKPGKRTPAKK